MKNCLKKYCILFLLLTHCSFLHANFDEYSPENVQKLEKFAYVVSGVAVASFFCFNVVRYKRAGSIGAYLQKHIQNFDVKRSFTRTFDYIARSPELFTWACIHTIFKA